jgi:hypothetical protein
MKEENEKEKEKSVSLATHLTIGFALCNDETFWKPYGAHVTRADCCHPRFEKN